MFLGARYHPKAPFRWCSGRTLASHVGDRGSISGRDRTKSLKQVVTALLTTLCIRCEGHGSLEMTTVKRRSLSQLVWHVKLPLLLNGHECQRKVKSPVMVTFPNE